MEEKTRFQLEKEKAEKQAIEKENKILRIVFPVVGVSAFIVGLLGFILTVTSGNPGITVFFVIMTLLGLVGALYGALLLVRIKKPNFLKKQVVEENPEDILPD